MILQPIKVTPTSFTDRLHEFEPTRRNQILKNMSRLCGGPQVSNPVSYPWFSSKIMFPSISIRILSAQSRLDRDLPCHGHFFTFPFVRRGDTAPSLLCTVFLLYLVLIRLFVGFQFGRPSSAMKYRLSWFMSAFQLSPIGKIWYKILLSNIFENMMSITHSWR